VLGSDAYLSHADTHRHRRNSANPLTPTIDSIDVFLGHFTSGCQFHDALGARLGVNFRRSLKRNCSWATSKAYRAPLVVPGAAQPGVRLRFGVGMAPGANS